MNKLVGLALLAFASIMIFFAGTVLPVDTELDIENPPPYLIGLIPNQSWSGGNLFGAFDLDDYFDSVSNSTLSYSYSGFSDITVVIDSENNVSFYPSASFSGTRTGYFYASDGSQNGSSNEVYLFIAIDSEPPKWISIEKDKGVIYQNDYVRFSSNWTDNFGLKNYTLSINQGSGYSNYSGTFSGLFNESFKSIQISAASGETISWFFCASDLSSNINCTDENTFVVSEKTIPPASTPQQINEDDSSTLSEKIKEVFKKEVNDFKVSLSSFLVSVKQGSAQTKILEITNTGNSALSFNLSISGLSEFAVLSNTFLTILPGETKKISVDFFSKKDTPPGHYFGEINILSVSDVVVPIVFEVNSLESDAEVNVNVFPDYKFVKPGQTVVANITLKNLKDPINEEVNLHLSIIDFYGKIYDSSDEAVFISSSVSMIRNFTIPKDMPLSEYVFHARVSTSDSVLSVGSDTFEVGTRFKFLAFVKSSSIFILIVLLSLFSVLLVLRYRSIAERKESLWFYVQSLELKKLMAMNKFDQAAQLFISMKNKCGEPITREMLEDKEELKEQMKILAQRFNLDENSVLNESKNSSGKIDEGKVGNEGGKVSEEDKKSDSKSKVIENEK